MTRRRRITLGSPLPISPKRRQGGALEELLQQFGSQSSATSATKARRESSFTTKERQPVPDSSARERKRSLRQQTRSKNPLPAINPITTPSTSDDRTEESDGLDDSSEDELAKPIRATRASYSKQHIGGLKMENRRKDATRRSTRNRKSDVLQSDTVEISPPNSKHRAFGSLPRKLDTARARLRDDIAHQTKVMADGFFVANKDYFLPLLPKYNYISKLVANEHPGSIVKYKRLKKQPEGVTATLKPYQLDGLSFLVHLHNNGFSGILGDEMGLGKTLQTLSLFQHLEEQDRNAGVTSEELRPYLVVCPLSVLNSWVNEAQKWTPELRVLRFHGTTNERNRLKKVALGKEDQFGNETLQHKDRKASRKAGRKVSKLLTDAGAESYRIVVTTYEIFHAEQAWFKHTFLWRYVVLDEGHKIKSSVSQISAALRHVSSEYRLILTGTPLQNNLVEMWALLAWLYPNVFTENTQTLFKESFDINRGQVNRQTLDDARSLLELIMLRRMKDSPDVNLGLPPKEEILLYVPLTPMQRFWYTRLLTRVDDKMLNDLFANGKDKEMAALDNDRQDEELLAQMEKFAAADVHEKDSQWGETAEIMRQAIEKEQSADITSAWRKLMNLVMQLRKCCSHPYLLPGALPDPYYVGEHIIRASGKFILLEKLLKHSILNQGKKVLIFSGFTRSLDCCEDLLSIISNFGKDFKFLRLDGGTARARRNLDIRLFNDPKSEYKVMLLSTRAGGLGINLTTAEDAIFLDEDWNPQITLQAEARAHRIGQTKKVTIYKLCTQGTVEEQMMGRIRKKLYLSTKITESMRNLHGEQTVNNSKGRPSFAEDMPEMNTTQLKTLVRRGAQTLSHPEIDVTEMLSWDLETMMQKCRDKPADPHADPNTEVDEEKWLSMMERVECAVFDGKRFQRQSNNKMETSADNILPDSITREDRRRNKNTTVTVNGYEVSKESMACADWEAVPTFAGKDARLAEPQREKRRKYHHEEHCVACFDGPDVGHLIECKSCPRTYHFDCLEPQYQAKVKGFSGFFCPQHACCECGKNTTDAGGLIYRCRWCPRGFCEDCLDDKEQLIAENLPEFEMLGERPAPGGFYIKCSSCIESAKKDRVERKWMEGMEMNYQEQHEEWVKEQEDEQQRLQKEQEAIQEACRQASENVQTNGKQSDGFGYLSSCPVLVDEEESSASPPALTDTSFATGSNRSGVSTPHLQGTHQRLHLQALDTIQGKKRSEMEYDDEFGESRQEKKARLDRRPWAMEADPLLKGLFQQ